MFYIQRTVFGHSLTQITLYMLNYKRKLQMGLVANISADIVDDLSLLCPHLHSFAPACRLR